MTNPKEKAKPVVPTRTPQKKTVSGMFDNLRPLPHPVEEILGFTSQNQFVQSRHNPSQPDTTHPNPSQPNLEQRETKDFLTEQANTARTDVNDISSAQPDTTQPNPTQPSPFQRDIAPVRDFNKRANSIDRDAMPKGHFPGTSYKLYNALYQRTRGAIVPVRTIQATKRELMEWSNIRSKNTIALNLQILLANGWLRRTLEIGDHGGSVYEVLIPEEVLNATQPDPTQPDPTRPNPTQKLGLDPTQQLGWVGLGKSIENEATYVEPKTFIKTKINTDDEAFAEFAAAVRKTAKEITGKEPSKAEAARWAEVAEVLMTELRIAAGRTNVSSVPAFLAEHLRRRLWKKEKQQIEAEAAEEKASAPAKKVDASKCPDCFGTGMWYPEGFEKGVARCQHSRLTSDRGE